MRLGGPLFEKYADPQEWVSVVKAAGYRGAFCPVKSDVPDDVAAAYEKAATEADIIIAEVGAWSNPLSTDETERAAAMKKCQVGLALADRIGARCCVNIAGSRGEKWDGPSPEDLTSDTFDMIVETVRDIIDAVNPSRSFYTLETMPWMYPDSVDSYLRLIKAIDRKTFAVHFDPVNLINCPQRYFENAAIIDDFVNRLGPHIRSCHAKDILLGQKLTVHLDEVCPGTGALDYGAYLRAIDRLDDDLPLMIEHMSGEEEYKRAAAFIRTSAEEEGVQI